MYGQKDASSVSGVSLTTSRDGAFEVNEVKWWMLDSPVV